jgi:hypothetical protein
MFFGQPTTKSSASGMSKKAKKACSTYLSPQQSGCKTEYQSKLYVSKANRHLTHRLLNARGLFCFAFWVFLFRLLWTFHRALLHQSFLQSLQRAGKVVGGKLDPAAAFIVNL